MVDLRSDRLVDAEIEMFFLELILLCFCTSSLDLSPTSAPNANDQKQQSPPKL